VKKKVIIRRTCKFGDPDYPYKVDEGISHDGKKEIILEVFPGDPTINELLIAGIIKEGEEEKVVRDNPQEFLANGSRVYYMGMLSQEVELRAFSEKYGVIIAVYTEE